MRQFHHDGLTFDVHDSGEGTRSQPIVLLHGFPQTNDSWADVTAELSAQGWRCLAPALRGFCAGAMPRERSAYRIEKLVGDVLALLDEAGFEQVHLVGHDWGGGIAWQTAMQFPERVRSLTVLSTPHPQAMQDAVRHSRQGLMSWYMLAMQIPVLPEALLGFGIRREGLRRLGLPREHEEAYLRWLRRPGAVRASISPYRGLFTRPSGTFRSDTPVRVSTTYVWGAHDAYLGRWAAEATAQHCTGEYRFVELDADHWLPEKQPDQVAEAIAERAGSTAV